LGKRAMISRSSTSSPLPVRAEMGMYAAKSCSAR
jgi:hypothetical protein